MKSQYWEKQENYTPKKALSALKKGNERFLKNTRYNYNNLDLIHETSYKQAPFAALLSCSDSRSPVETLFDQGIGDLFNVRLAGNIANTDAIASLEFACAVLGSKLIVVLGHTSCGAVKGACDKVELGSLSHLLASITPAVEKETETTGDRSSKNADFVHKVTHLNIQHQIGNIMSSDILRKMIQEEKVGIIGAIYDVATGQVDFYDNDIFPL